MQDTYIKLDSSKHDPKDFSYRKVTTFGNKQWETKSTHNKTPFSPSLLATVPGYPFRTGGLQEGGWDSW